MNQPIIENMKIRSITDVITNSSSETFIISYPSPSEDPKKLQDLLREYRADCGEGEVNSGMGGILKVSYLEPWLEGELCGRESTRELCYISRIPWIPESLVVEIDHSLRNTIDFFLECCPEAYDIDEKTIYPIYDKEGKKIIRLTSDYREWKSLGDPLQMHGEWAFFEMNWWNYEDKD